jgi:hypothetical protein
MKHSQRAEKQRRKLGLGAPKPDHSLQLMSTARRFARQDRCGRPIHCFFAKKLIYDTNEIARSTGQQLARIAAKPHFLYLCKSHDTRGGNHWHLTTQQLGPTGAPNEQA